VTALTQLLHDADAGVRLAAVEALGRIGRPARSAAADLLRAQHDADERVRRSATVALLHIIHEDVEFSGRAALFPPGPLGV
jgi:HEAT repeat protein